MSDSEDQESILNNLNKTRQLWSSKADLGTPDYLIPKSPLFSSVATSKKTLLPNGNTSITTEVVRPDEQVVEDFELPNIKAMRSKWEVSSSESSVFTPNAKPPAAIASEKSPKRELVPPQEPVNRMEAMQEEESYDVELNKLKAQFESAAKAASKTRPKSPKPMSNASIKEQVIKSSPVRQQSTGNTNKKIRFEDEMTSTNQVYVTEQRTETESLAVNLSGLKSQFENRKDEHLVTPGLSNKKAQPDRGGMNRIAASTLPLQISSIEVDGSSHGNQSVTPHDQPVKSSEPVYDEMIGEESVKDRLKRYNTLTGSLQSSGNINTASQKRELTPILKRESENKIGVDPEVIRSPPAGTKEAVDYIPSVDLRQAKAIFETSQPKTNRQTFGSKRSSFSSSSSSPSRTGRSSSRQSISSSRSSSRKRSTSLSSEVRSSISDFHSEQSMTEVVKPPPAGTKETPDYVPSVKLSSVKSMFENSSSPTSAAPLSPRRRQPSRDSCTSSEIRQVTATEQRKEASEDAVADEREVVRPPSAGTKETPDYALSADVLKARAAIFNAPPPEQYTPRNKVNAKPVHVAREVVNTQPEQPDTDYELSQSLKDTKKLFEQGGTDTAKIRPAEKQQLAHHSPPPTCDVVRPPPAGTKEIDIVPASDIRSVKSRFENQQAVEVESGSRKKPIDIRMEAAEALKREKEIIANKSVAPEILKSNEAEPAPEIQYHEVVEPKQPEPKPRLKEPEKVIKALRDENREDSEQNSDTNSEGKIVVQKEINVMQKQQESAEVLVDEEAAAVVPIRVTVPDFANENSSSSSNSSDVEDRDSLDEASFDDSKLSPDSSGSLEVEISKPKYEIVEVEQKSGMSVQEEDDDDDFDKPHFHYNYEDSDSAPVAETGGAELLVSGAELLVSGAELPASGTGEAELPASGAGGAELIASGAVGAELLADGAGGTESLIETNGSVFESNVLLNTSSTKPTGNGGALLDFTAAEYNNDQNRLVDSNFFSVNSTSKSDSILLLDSSAPDLPVSSNLIPSSSIDLFNGLSDIEPTMSDHKQTDKPLVMSDSSVKIGNSDDPFDLFGSAPVVSSSSQETSPKDPFDLFLQ